MTRLEHVSTGNRGGFSSGFSVKVEGMDNVLMRLRQMPDKMKRSTILKSLRAATKGGGMITAIANQAPVLDRDVVRKNSKGQEDVIHSGTLRESIGNITGKSKTYPNVMVGARAKRGHKGWYAHFVEEGHKTHTGGRTDKDEFMKRGYDATASTVTRLATLGIAKIIKRLAKKQGF